MTKTKCCVYLAHALTGRSGKDIVKESATARFVLHQYGLNVLDPATVEDISYKQKEVRASESDLREFWKRDKQMIRQADVVLDLTGAMKSEGVAHEIGYARYCLWIPVVRLYPGLQTSIARIEDDYIAQSIYDAGLLIRNNWGSYNNRLVWRVKLLVRCLPKWLYQQIKRWVQ